MAASAAPAEAEERRSRAGKRREARLAQATAHMAHLQKLQRVAQRSATHDRRVMCCDAVEYLHSIDQLPGVVPQGLGAQQESGAHGAIRWT